MYEYKIHQNMRLVNVSLRAGWMEKRFPLCQIFPQIVDHNTNLWPEHQNHHSKKQSIISIQVPESAKNIERNRIEYRGVVGESNGCGVWVVEEVNWQLSSPPPSVTGGYIQFSADLSFQMKKHIFAS